MHTKLHSLCCKCFRKKITYLCTKFFKRHLRNKIITVDSSINDVYAFSPIYFSTFFPHFQFLRELWMSLAFLNRTLWTDSPLVLRRSSFRTGLKYLWNCILDLAVLHFYSFTKYFPMHHSSKNVFRNIYGL